MIARGPPVSVIGMVRQKLKQLHVTDREEWRTWLEKNHDVEQEIWLIYYKKHTGKPRIPYDDAVEEAICYGWIDSTVKRLDDEKYMQKYTPRKAKSIWSELNKTRAGKMIKAGRMTETGLERIREAKRSGEWKKARSLDPNGAQLQNMKKELNFVAGR